MQAPTWLDGSRLHDATSLASSMKRLCHLSISVAAFEQERVAYRLEAEVTVAALEHDAFAHRVIDGFAIGHAQDVGYGRQAVNEAEQRNVLNVVHLIKKSLLSRRRNRNLLFVNLL